MAGLNQSVDQITGNIMASLGLSNDKRFLIRNHLLDFLYEFRNNVKAEIKTVQKSPIPQSLIIPLEQDFIAYSKVGWVVSGSVHIVSENPNIANILTQNQSGVFQETSSSFYNGYGTRTGTISGQIIPELDGYFKIDEESRCIRLSTVNVFPNFYMEYVSGCAPDGTSLIHAYAYLFSKAWCQYHYLRNAYNIPVHQIENAKLELDIQERKTKRLLKGLSVKAILDSWDKNVGGNE